MTAFTKTQRKDLIRLIHWFCWRILPHSVYANKLWTLADVAAIINREVGFSGTAVITEALVLSMVKKKKCVGNGDEFSIQYLEGYINPHRRQTQDVVPFRGTKRPIGTKGRDTTVFGWSSGDTVDLPVGKLSASSVQKMKVGEVEGDEEMMEELQSILGGGNEDTDKNTAQNGRGPPGATAAATAAAGGSAAAAGKAEAAGSAGSYQLLGLSDFRAKSDKICFVVLDVKLQLNDHPKRFISSLGL